MRDAATERNDERGAFGPLLRSLRLAARLSQEELAERARLSVVSISALERGRRRAPYPETLRLLGDALQLAQAQRRELAEAAQRRLPRDSTDGADDAGESMTVTQPAGDAPRSNLPPSRTRLIGRDADVAAVVALVREHRLVTILGTGGIGKTRTALAAGEVLLGADETGVWFVDLAPLAHGSFVADAVARALGVKELADRPLVQTLLAYLKHKAAVLIFDNCEHVITQAAALADELLRGCERVTVLATGRERLRLDGEHVYRLPPLAVPESRVAARLRAADAGSYAALALFIERAQAADPAFTLRDADVPAIATICRLLDGLALAIELAAARVSILSPSALLTRLDERFRLLTRGERSALPRHQTLRALIDWSYELLTPREQRMFARLSVFAGGCDLTEAGSVCGNDDDDEFAIRDVFVSLVDKSLVMTTSAGRDLRYRLLESARMYAAEKLTAHAESQDIRRRHAAAYLHLAEILERDRNVAPDAEWVPRAQAELENWRAALSWCFGPGGDVAIGQRLAGALRPVWVSQATAAGRRWIDAALARATAATPPPIALKLRFGLAHIAFVSAEYAAALEQSLPLIEACAAAGDAAGQAFAEYFAGGALVSLGRVDEGAPLLEHALLAARAQGNLRLTGLALEDIAYGKSVGSDPATARPYYAEALEIWTVIGAKRNAANSASLLAENTFLSGDLDAALRYSHAAIAQLRTLAYTRNLIVALNNFATYLNMAARWNEARDAAREALALAEETEAAVACVWSLQHLAATAVLGGETGPGRERAALVLGYVDARLAAQGSQRAGSEQQEYMRVRASLDASLNAGEFKRLAATGALLLHERAVELARAL